MEIKPFEMTVEKLVEGYRDDGQDGVAGYGGLLDIRPPFQREFVYNDKQRKAVIATVTQGHPLSVMYWAESNDGQYEIIDGQQRTISICQYCDNVFSFKDRYFHNLPEDKQEQILKYEPIVYVCQGEESEKLEWFETINIAGEPLTPQELRNAVYSGPWVSDAKRYFSRRNGPAYDVGGKYLKGATDRQEHLEAAINWISGGLIEDYMGSHANDKSAEPLWDYFTTVIEWVEKTFPTYRKEMKGLPWGALYRDHSDSNLDPDALEEEIKHLLQDDDVTSNKGIYQYLLTGEERHLNLRTFDDKVRRKVYEKQNGICAVTGEAMNIDDMEADHIKPWSKGGATIETNCQMVSKAYNRRKGAR